MAFQRLETGEKRLIRSLGAREAMPGEALQRFALEHPDCEIAVEPARLADWSGGDIDKGSAYKNPETVARFRAVCHAWGIPTFLASSSLYPNGRVRGLRIYLLLGKLYKRHERANLVTWLASQAGIKPGKGQFEIMPQQQDWTPEIPVHRVGQRFTVPFQTAQSRLLDEDLTPINLDRDGCLGVVDGLAAEANVWLVEQAVAIACAIARKKRAKNRQHQPQLRVVRKRPQRQLLPGQTNDPLVMLAADYVQAFNLTEESEAAAHARAFLAELRAHPQYSNCSADTVTDLEQRNRAERLLLSAIRYRKRRKATRGTQKAQEGPSPASPLARQRAAYRRLLWGLQRAAGQVWRNVTVLSQWLIKHAGVSHGFLWKDLVRPVWQWMGKSEGESLEFCRARDLIGINPPIPPENSQQPGEMKAGQTPQSSVSSRGLNTPESSSNLVPVRLPDWADDFDQLVVREAENWSMLQRALFKVEKHRERAIAAGKAAIPAPMPPPKPAPERQKLQNQQRLQWLRKARNAQAIDPLRVVDGFDPVAAAEEQLRRDLAEAAARRQECHAASPLVDRASETDKVEPPTFNPVPVEPEPSPPTGILARTRAAQGRLGKLLARVASAGPEAPAEPVTPAAGALAKARISFDWDATQQQFINRATGTGRTPAEIAVMFGCDQTQLQLLLEQSDSTHRSEA